MPTWGVAQKYIESLQLKNEWTYYFLSVPHCFNNNTVINNDVDLFPPVLTLQSHEHWSLFGPYCVVVYQIVKKKNNNNINHDNDQYE